MHYKKSPQHFSALWPPALLCLPEGAQTHGPWHRWKAPIWTQRNAAGESQPAASPRPVVSVKNVQYTTLST